MTAPAIDRVVVVGAGISGLAAAIAFASLGRRVVLVDQHRLPGGYLQSFTRNGCRFEVGFHHIGASLPGEIFARYLKRLGVYDDLVLLPHRDDALFRLVLSDGSRMDIPRGPGPMAAMLKRRFPAEAAGIDAVMADVAACVDETPWLGLRRDRIAPETYWRRMETPLSAVVEPRIAAPALREAFYSFAFNAALPPDRCPFGAYAFLFHVLSASCARVRGGGAALVDAFVRRFRDLGGTLLLGRSAERLRVEGSFARALELSDGTALDLDLLVSTCHPLETVRFCGRERFRDAFLEQLDAQEQTPGSFKVLLETSRPVESLGCDPWLLLDDAPAWQPALYVSAPTALDPDPGGRHVAEILFWQDFRAVEAWQGSSFGRRPPEYLAFKDRLADAAIDRIERDLPGLRASIVRRHTASPLTNLHYTRSARGSAMGASQDVRHQGRNHLRPRNRIRNLFLAGQSLGQPGIIGCVVHAMMLCDAILPEMSLLRRLRDVTF